MSDQRRLTGKEQAFALRIIAGDQPSVAYAAAGYSPSHPRITKVAAQRTLNRPAVAAFINEHRAKAAARATFTREQKLERLAQRARNGDMIDRDGIKALEVHNTMTGDNAPTKVHHSGIGEIIAFVRANSKK